jgi:hypothetical protein
MFNRSFIEIKMGDQTQQWVVGVGPSLFVLPVDVNVYFFFFSSI